MTRLLLPAAMLLAALLACAPRGGAPRGTERSRMLMGTLCSVLVPGDDTPADRRAAERALDEISRLDGVMSSWRDDSELAAFHRARGAFSCSEDLFAVLDSSLVWAEATDGAFDPTIEPLVRAWDLRGNGRVPSPAERMEARRRVGWRRLRLDHTRRTATLDPGSAIDLGGIGKGYALDRAAAKLREAGSTSALLDFGGEVLALGSAPAGGGWRIPVADPAERTRPIVELMASDCAIATSGQSERGFESNGRRYGHIVDPRSGLPVDSRGSVTVVASSATRADAVSTALFVAGREAAGEWALRHPEDGVIWLEPAVPAARLWSWNVAPRVLPGARVVRMNAAASGRSPP